MTNTTRLSILKAIVLGGLLAAVLDILDPIVFYGLRYGTPAIRILQSIAAALLGRQAYTGGINTALLGLALHIFIALTWAAIFVLASRRLAFLSRNAITAGLLYGLIIFAIMNFVVLPHTHAPAKLPTRASLYNGIAAVVFLVGLPISLVNHYLAPRPRVSS